VFGFGKETVYLGYSIEKLSRVRQILEQNGIKYNYSVTDHGGQLLDPVRGTARSAFGSAGMDAGYEKQYEVKVGKKDSETAKKLLMEVNG